MSKRDWEDGTPDTSSQPGPSTLNGHSTPNVLKAPQVCCRSRISQLFCSRFRNGFTDNEHTRTYSWTMLSSSALSRRFHPSCLLSLSS